MSTNFDSRCWIQTAKDLFERLFDALLRLRRGLDEEHRVGDREPFLPTQLVDCDTTSVL